MLPGNHRVLYPFALALPFAMMPLSFTSFLWATLAAVAVKYASAEDSPGGEGPSPWPSGFGPDVIQIPDAMASPYFANITTLNGTEDTAVSGTDGEQPHFVLDGRASDFYLRIMPLGASIVWGQASTDGNGFRKYVRDQLRVSGWNVNMVGSVSSGNMHDNQNEGHSGWVITQVQDAAKGSIWMHPNVILINVGTNDCRGNIDPGNAGARLKTLIDYLFSAVPSTTIIYSTLIPSPDFDACMQNVNSQYRALLDQYQGKRIALADMHAFLTMNDISGDGTHPNDYGYKKMAAVWWDAFQKVQSVVQPPDNAVDDTISAAAATCPKVAGNARGPIQTQRGSGYDNGNYLHSSADMGVVLTIPDQGIQNYYFGQLINAGGAPRGGEEDELIWTQNQTDGSFKYFFRQNTGGTFSSTWTEFQSPLGCKGSVTHAFKDLNNDGLDDLWCIGAQGQASVAINRGGNPPTFESIGQVKASPGSYVATDVRIADIDGDGRADYCVIHANGDIGCWRNGGQGDTVAYWQGFTGVNDLGSTVFTGKGKGNKNGVFLGDINGDFRDDWMWISDTGSIETYINQRGWGYGIVPNWIYPGITHVGMDTPGAGSRIKLGRLYGTGRLDYVYMKANGKNIDMHVWKNQGSGGTRVKGDGVYYCDMTGSGRDDYVWVWSDGHAAVFFGNIHNPPYWSAGTDQLFNIQRSRRSIYLADWDGDGKCDVLSQRQSDGALEMWKNNWTAEKGWNFVYQGFVSGPATCAEGWGVNIFDRGLALVDIDGDKRADYLCIEKNGRTTAWLNARGGMSYQGQIKHTEGWDRANLRWGSVEGSGKADLIHTDKYTGEGLYAGIDRGNNMNFANLGGLGRMDLIQVLPISNRAFTYFNECPGGGGGDDGTPQDPQLPDASGSGSGSGSGECIAGTGPDGVTDVCAFACKYGYCPDPCDCTQFGASIPPPLLIPGVIAAGRGSDGEDARHNVDSVCQFTCAHGYCPSAECELSPCSAVSGLDAGAANDAARDRGTYAFLASFMDGVDKNQNLDVALWARSPENKGSTSDCSVLAASHCEAPSLCDTLYRSRNAVPVFWALSNMVNFHETISIINNVLVWNTISADLKIPQIVTDFPVQLPALQGDDGARGYLLAAMGGVGAALGITPGIGPAIGAILSIFSAIAAAVPAGDGAPGTGPDPTTLLSNRLADAFESTRDGLAQVLIDVFVKKDVSKWKVPTTIPQLLGNGTYLQPPTAEDQQQLQDKLTAYMQTYLVGTLLKADNYYIMANTYTTDHCALILQAYKGGARPPPVVIQNNVCYVLQSPGQGWSTNTAPPYDQETYSKSPDLDTLLNMEKWGVNVQDVIRGSINCQATQKNYDGDVMPDFTNFSQGYPECWYSLPVLFGELPSDKFPYYQSPCAVEEKSHNTDDRVVGVTYLPDNLAAIFDVAWYCCYADSDTSWNELCIS
ncbi:hypothetical protein GQ53DRAFT_865088 [Thozetella sp. PMI_491]|nr:hypothetical protein GQ53DRAFT_865088 [Thozetella sp. PMI_491]